MKNISKKLYKRTTIIGLVLICLVLFVLLDSTQRQLTHSASVISSKDSQIKEVDYELGLSKIYSQEIDEIYSLSMQELEDKEKEIDSLKASIDILNKNNKNMESSIDALGDQPTIEDNFEKIAYLTFDDGPSYNTPRVLKILERYHIKATFFVVYSRYGENNDLYNQILNEGHAIGNHTYDHTKALRNWDNFLADFKEMEDFLIENTGQKTHIFRFPGGTSQNWYGMDECLENVQQLRDQGYQYFDWNVSTSDGGTNHVSKEDILSFVAGRSKRQDKIIVLMHDRADKDTTVEALPEIIEYLRYQGYVFLPLSTQSFTKQFFDITQEDRLG